jgi:hypothetical protein
VKTQGRFSCSAFLGEETDCPHNRSTTLICSANSTRILTRFNACAQFASTKYKQAATRRKAGYLADSMVSFRHS